MTDQFPDSLPDEKSTGDLRDQLEGLMFGLGFAKGLASVSPERDDLEERIQELEDEIREVREQLRRRE